VDVTFGTLDRAGRVVEGLVLTAPDICQVPDPLESPLGDGPPETQEGPIKDKEGRVHESYRIHLMRQSLIVISKEDTLFTLRGDNRVKRKLLLPASDCRWMLEFTDYK
jgi:hypothetical protein